MNVNTGQPTLYNAWSGAAQLEVGYLTVCFSWPSALNCLPPVLLTAVPLTRMCVLYGCTGSYWA